MGRGEIEGLFGCLLGDYLLGFLVEVCRLRFGSGGGKKGGIYWVRRGKKEGREGRCLFGEEPDQSMYCA